MMKGSHLNRDITSFIQPVIQVIETIPIHDLLIRMQKERTHMAILLDEYGGTSGLITVEDIIEEIIGEVRDEFDTNEVAEIRTITANHYIIDAKLSIRNVNEVLGIHLFAEDVDTIGGWFLTQTSDAKEVARAEVKAEGYLFKVHGSDGYHIKYLEVKKS